MEFTIEEHYSSACIQEETFSYEEQQKMIINKKKVELQVMHKIAEF